MIEVRTAHTAELDTPVLDAVRTLLFDAFNGDFTDHDWDHTLGGIHAIAWDGGEVVGHASIVQRRLVHAGRALRTGYIEGVGVRADQRRRGCGTALMVVLERFVRGGYEVGALGASEDGAALYATRGWQLWQGTTWALNPAGRERTEDEDDCVYVLPVSASLDLTGELTADWRDGGAW
ncbi:MAG TPA: GNAT family N-acetyltransferase [Pseudonocardiaceae bacterium]|nr:GNAT family N-acetyltransferase [Pseudonocardiaceae bacterium]